MSAAAAAFCPVWPEWRRMRLITEKKADDSGVSCPKGVALAQPAPYAVLAEAQLRSTSVFPIGDPMKLPLMTAALVAAALATSPFWRRRRLRPPRLLRPPRRPPPRRAGRFGSRR